MTTRYSIASTTPTLKVVNVSQIPDPDCPHSFFDRVRIIGDLSGYDMRDWTLVNKCDLSGVTGLPPGDRMRFIYSRGPTNWPIGIIPDDIPLHNLDLGAAWLRQRAPQLSGQNVAIANHLANYAISNYNLSAINVIYEIENQFGVPDKATAKDIFATASVFKARVDSYEHLDTAPKIQNMEVDLTAVRVLHDQPLDLSDEILPTPDRWLLRQHLEVLHPEVLFWIPTLDPLYILGKSRRGVKDEEFWYARLQA